MIISLISAMGKNRIIGIANGMPWHLPADFKWFKRHTLGKTIIMGRKTFESIGRPLPKRHNIVITRQVDWQAEGVTVVHDLEAALRQAEILAESDEMMIIGGGDIYEQALPLSDKMYLTQVDIDVEGDTYFPNWSTNEWKEEFREVHPKDEQNAHNMTFMIYQRDSVKR